MGRRRGKIKRDSKGRFASTGGGAAAGAAAGAAVGAALGSKTARSRLVAGSVRSESHIGTTKDGNWTGAKVGARYAGPGGRQVVVKAIVGVSKPKAAAKKKPRVKATTKKTTGTRVRTR